MNSMSLGSKDLKKITLDYDEEEILEFYGLDNSQPSRWPTVALELKGESEGTSVMFHPEAMIDRELDFEDPLMGSNSSAGPRRSNRRRREAILIALDRLGSDRKERFSTSSELFSPKSFLCEFHRETSMDELRQGAARLRNNLERRTETLKLLVRDNFDLFLECKDSIDSVFSKLQKKGFGGEMDINNVRDILQATSRAAEEVFRPMIERRRKAEKLRIALSAYERHKFLFSLPNVLQEAIKKQEFDVAVRDYRRGKQMMQEAKSAVFVNVWREVERIVSLLQTRLFEQLLDPLTNPDIQERLIGYLTELDSEKDPFWTYLENQVQWVQNLLKFQASQYNERMGLILVNANERKRSSLASPRRSRGASVFEPLLSPTAIEGTSSLSSLLLASSELDSDKEICSAKEALVSQLCSVLVSALPDLWRISKSFLDGKFVRAIAASDRRRLQRQPTTTTKEPTQNAAPIRKAIDGLLEQFDVFLQTTMASSTSEWRPESISLISRSCLSIANQLVECHRVLLTCRIPSDYLQRFASCFATLKTKFITSVCDLLLRASRDFYRQERWLSSSSTSKTTALHLPSSFFNLLVHNVRTLCLIALSSLNEGGESTSMDALRGTFSVLQSVVPECLVAFLDTLHLLAIGSNEEISLSTGGGRASADEAPATGTLQPMSPRPARQTSSLSLSPGATVLDVASPEIRLLVALSNADFLRRHIEDFTDKVELLSKGNVRVSRADFVEQIDLLSGIFRDRYTTMKSITLLGFLRAGLVKSGLDWASAPKPTSLRSYIYDLLLELVTIHAQIQQSAAAVFTQSLLSNLVGHVAAGILDCVRAIDRFSVGGMLQVRFLYLLYEVLRLF